MGDSRRCYFESGGERCLDLAARPLMFCRDHAGPESLKMIDTPLKQKDNGGSSSYYELPHDCQTLQDIIVKQEMDFTQGNIFKAAYRWDKKPDLSYNLRKIIWFAEDALRRMHESDPNNPRSDEVTGHERK